MMALAQSLSTGARRHGHRQASAAFPAIGFPSQISGRIATGIPSNRFSSAVTRPTAIKELDRVSLLAEVATGGGRLPVGSFGTVVYRYRDGVAFEVEFVSPIPALLTLHSDEVSRAV